MFQSARRSARTRSAAFPPARGLRHDHAPIGRRLEERANASGVVVHIGDHGLWFAEHVAIGIERPRFKSAIAVIQQRARTAIGGRDDKAAFDCALITRWTAGESSDPR